MAEVVLNDKSRELIYRFHKFLSGQRPVTKPADETRDVMAALHLVGQNVSTYLNDLTSKKTIKLRKLKKSEKFTDMQYQIIRHNIMNTHMEKKALPEITSLVQKYNLTAGEDFLGDNAVRKNLEEMGFTFYRNKYILERAKTRQQRLNYLKAIKEAKSAGKNIVYVLVKLIITNKRRTYMFACAAGSQGFLQGSFKVFNAEQRVKLSNSLHGWIASHVMSKIPVDSVIVLDKEVHAMFSRDAPIMLYPKKMIMNWLSRHGVDADANLSKPELCYILKQHRAHYLQMELGVPVLHLPKYDKFLNPLEGVWSIVEYRIADHLSSKGLLEMVETEFCEESWDAGLKQAVLYEDSFLEEEAVLETHLDAMMEECSKRPFMSSSEDVYEHTEPGPSAPQETSHDPPNDNDNSEEPATKLAKLLTEEIDLSSDEDDW